MTLKAINEGNIKRRRAKIIKLKKICGGKCSMCGYEHNFACLDFHHKNPADKLFGINTSTIMDHPWHQVLAEADKCVLLCRNCHSDFHNPQMRSNLFDKMVISNNLEEEIIATIEKNTKKLAPKASVFNSQYWNIENLNKFYNLS